MTLSWESLDAWCCGNGISAYICNEPMFEIKKEVKADNPDISSFDWKCETISRMLFENLDYEKFKEQENEPDDIHSKNMEIRWSICDRVAELVVNGSCSSLREVQEKVNEIIKGIKE